MKLQITDQQLNLQLKPDEIEDLKEGFPLSVNVSFGAALAPFTCQLSATYDQPMYSIAYSEGAISILAPITAISQWADAQSDPLAFNISSDTTDTLEVVIGKES